MLMLVIDVTDSNSRSSLDSWHAQFVKLAKPKCPDKLPVIVVGNKVDQTRADTGGGSRTGENNTQQDKQQSAAPPINREEVISWCRSKTTNFCYIETSAVTGEGVEEAFRSATVRGLAA